MRHYDVNINSGYSRKHNVGPANYDDTLARY